MGEEFVEPGTATFSMFIEGIYEAVTVSTFLVRISFLVSYVACGVAKLDLTTF